MIQSNITPDPTKIVDAKNVDADSTVIIYFYVWCASQLSNLLSRALETLAILISR